MDKQGRFDMIQHPRLKLTALCVAAAVAQLAATAAQADSGIGVDTTLGNALNPRTFSSVGYNDPEGLGETANSRTPTGLLNQEPRVVHDPRKTDGGWSYNGYAEFGLIGSRGDKGNAKYKEYKDLGNGGLVNTFGLEMDKADSAWFFDIKGGGVGRDDQYYGLSLGRYNDWSLKGFYSETPHVFTSTYRNLWNGVGSSNLTLRGGLTPGGAVSAAATSASIQNVVTNTPYSDLEIIRKKGGLRFDMNFAGNWKAFASYTKEKREGARPFGMVGGGGGGTGPVEIPESINMDSHDFFAGLQWADRLNALNLSLKASFFRNKIDTLTVQTPLFVAAANGIAAGGFPTARYDMHPDNDYYNLKGEYSRLFPEFWNGRFTAVVSAARLSQNDSMIPSTTNPAATAGIAGGQWNTLASLSDSSPSPKITTRLIDLGLSLNPVNDLDVRGKFRHYKTDNSTEYWACNPLTGQFGRMINDGGGASFADFRQANGLALTPGQRAALNAFMAGNGCNAAALRNYAAANGLIPAAANIPIRNTPFEYTQQNISLAADYRLNRNNSLNASFEREDFDREHRERKETREDKYKIGYVNRSFEGGTLRLSFEHDRKRGSTYRSDPYDEFLAASLGPLPTVAGVDVSTYLHALAQFRKYDLADRNQNILNARFNYALAENLDGMVNLQLKDIDYPADWGRKDKSRQNSLNFDLNWRQSEKTNVMGFYSYQDGRLSQASIQSNNAGAGLCVLPAGILTEAQSHAYMMQCASAGSPTFPLNRAFYNTSKDRSDVLGLGLSHDFGKAKLDVNYTYAKSRTKINYKYDAIGLAVPPAQVALAGNGFPSLTLTQHVVETNLLVPFDKMTSFRLLYRYESGKIRDWHYAGVDVNPVPGVQQVYLDAGPQDYRVHLLGAMVKFDF